jgi:transposase InsO family protein
MGPKEAHSSVLSPEEEAIVVAFRRHTLLPLDDCLYSLQPTVPHLTRPTLHRCLERHGISRLPRVGGDKPPRQRFATYAIGYVHIDLAEVCTEEGKLRLFVAIGRTSKLSFVRLVESAGKTEAADFLRDPVEAVPYRIHMVLTDSGVQFTARKQDIWDGQHIFDRVCDEHGIQHRVTKVNHPWTNGQVERMNRTIKDATVRRYYYESHGQLRVHLQLFVDAYNNARRLKTLRGLTPSEFIHQAWTKASERFRLKLLHHTPGPTPKLEVTYENGIPCINIENSDDGADVKAGARRKRTAKEDGGKSLMTSASRRRSHCVQFFCALASKSAWLTSPFGARPIFFSTSKPTRMESGRQRTPRPLADTSRALSLMTRRSSFTRCGVVSSPLTDMHVRTAIAMAFSPFIETLPRAKITVGRICHAFLRQFRRFLSR